MRMGVINGLSTMAIILTLQVNDIGVFSISYWIVMGFVLNIIINTSIGE